MYRGVFTVGVAVTEVIYNTDGTLSSEDLISANALTDYSYINARDGDPDGDRLARCLTGLGPASNDGPANGLLGGFSLNGNMISGSCSRDVIHIRPGGAIAGVINMRQCNPFSTAAEGVYTCTMMNSSMADQSIRFGVYFTGRSELLDLYIPSLNHLSSLYTAAPVIDSPSSSIVTVNIGSSLTLSCTSRGSPPDTFTWRKDNDPTVLQSTSITAVDYTSTSAVFRSDYSIASITTSDSGTYTCTVTNPIGSDSTTITVVDISKLLHNYFCG